MRSTFSSLCAATAALFLCGLVATAAERLPVARVILKEDFQARRYPGRVVAIEQVDITARVSGEIVKQNFNNGDWVKKGQVLYTLDAIKYEAALRNAEAKVAEYKARVNYAENDARRQKQLFEDDAASRDQLENAESTRDAFVAALRAAEADVVSAKDDLKNCTITAPIAGKLGSTAFTRGNYITPNSGVLVKLIQMAPIRVQFSISARDFLTMFEGKAETICKHGVVTLVLANDAPYAETGVIEYIENRAEDNTDTIPVFAVFKNAENLLRPQGIVSVTLKSNVGRKLPAVTPSALLQDIRGAFVWVVDEKNTAHKQYVTRGRTTPEWQFIEHGLKEGLKIVIDGTHKVAEGMVIEPVEATETTKGDR